MDGDGKETLRGNRANGEQDSPNEDVVSFHDEEYSVHRHLCSLENHGNL